MVVEYTEKQKNILRRWKSQPGNAIIRMAFNDADRYSKKAISSPSDAEKGIIDRAQEIFAKKGSAYTEEVFILMELKSNFLYGNFGLVKFFGNYIEANFKSPIEVLGCIPALLLTKWNPNRVKINALDSSGKYEVDTSVFDLNQNELLLTDFQGGLTHKNKEMADKKRVEYFKGKAKYLQIEGKTLVNNFYGVIQLMKNSMPETYSEKNNSYVGDRVKNLTESQNIH